MNSNTRIIAKHLQIFLTSLVYEAIVELKEFYNYSRMTFKHTIKSIQNELNKK